MRLVWRQAVVGVLAASVLTACAGEVSRFQVQMDGMIGRATKDQFLKNWGPPVSRVMEDQVELWLYRKVLLQFDREGILRGWHHHQE